MNPFTHIVASAVLSGIGLLVIILIPFGIRKAKKIQSWPSTPGRITASGVVFSSGRIGVWEPKLSYTYTVDGREYTGKVITLVETDTGSVQLAEAKIAPYPVGREVTVFYNPRKPRDSLLQKQWSYGDFVVIGLVGAVFLAVGIFFWFYGPW